MKTRRNHRKTTNSRRRRVVKQQRGQTRIYHRKGTVSSGRRHKFFKRGGQFGRYHNSTLNINSVYVAPLSQNEIDTREKAEAAAAAQAEKVSQEAAKLNYPEVDAFVQNIKKTTFVTQYLGDTVQFSILKLPQKRFSYDDVKDKEKQFPVNINGAMFYVSFNGCNVNIYVDGTLYGRVQIITSNGTDIDTENVCSNQLANAIILDLKYAQHS